MTASALDQVKYTVEDGIWDVSIVAGPSNDKVPEGAIPSGVQLETLRKPLLSIGGLIELYQVLKVLDPDVVHVHHARSGLAAAVVNLFRCRAFLVEDGAQRDNYRLPTRIMFTVLQIMATHVVFVSQAVRKSLSRLERSLIGTSKVSVIYYGLELPKVNTSDQTLFRARYNLKDGERIFAHTGRLIPVKNQKGILDLFAKLVREKEGKLLIAGDGPLRTELEKYAHDVGIGDMVIFLGLLDRNDIYTLLSISKFFVMMSHTEGHSVSLLEAMGYGCIPILSDIASFRETVNEDNAIFVTDFESCYDDIIKKMQGISQDEVIDYYRTRYSRTKMMSDYYSLYDTCTR
ncbi:MAG: glycosyltransferase family 4 protein [Allomuricauda sp.]